MGIPDPMSLSHPWRFMLNSRRMARMSCFFAFLLLAVTNDAPAQTKVKSNLPLLAVMSPAWQGLDSSTARLVSDALADELMRTGKVRVMERDQMRQILKEQDFQQSGNCDGSECAVEVGRLLSIDNIVVGTIGRLGSSYTISMRLVKVESGEIIGSSRRMKRGEIDEVVSEVLPQVAQELVESFSNSQKSAQISAPTPTPSQSTSALNSSSTTKAVTTSNAPQAYLFPRAKATAQESGFQFGIDAAIFVTDPSFSSAASPLSPQIGYGIKTGLDGKYDLNPRFALKIGASYLFTSWGESYSDSVSSLKETIISQFISLDADAILSLKRFRFIGGLGIDIPIDAKSTSTYSEQANYGTNYTLTSSADIEDNLLHTSYYLEAGAGFAFTRKLSLNILARIPLNEYITNVAKFYQYQLDLIYYFN